MFVLPSRYFLLLLLAVGLAYLPGLNGPLLFDSHIALTANTKAQPDIAVADSWRVAALSSDSSSLGRPLAMLTFAVQHALAGDWVNWQLKLGNLLIHLLTGYLFYALVIGLMNGPIMREKRSVSPEWIALLAAGLWLSHPLFVSSVLYTVQRMAQLSMLFTMLGLLTYTRYRNVWLDRVPKTGDVLALVLWLLLITVLAMLAKENGVLLLWLLPAVELSFYSGRVMGRYLPKLRALAWAALAAPVCLGLLFYLLSPEWFEGRYIHRDFSMSERVLTQGRILWHYLLWTLLPNINWMGLHHDDIAISRGLWTPVTTGLAVLAWLVLVAVAFWQRQRWPLLLFAVLCYGIGHSIESSIIGLELVYEHRNYLPLAGVFLLLAWLVTQSVAHWQGWRRFVPGVFLLVLCLLLTFSRSDRWSNELIMGVMSAQHHPDSARSHYQYGRALLDILDEKGAEAPVAVLKGVREQYLQMLALDADGLVAPVTLLFIDSTFPPVNLDNLSWMEQIAKRARTSRLSAQDANALLLLVECVGKGRCDADDKDILQMLSALHLRFPKSGKMRYLQAELLSYRPEHSLEAIDLARQALRLEPGNLRYAYTLIQLLVKQEDYGEALEVISQLSRYDNRRRELLQVKKMLGPAP